MTTKSTAV